jgi:enoyl-CoA hydratase
MAYDNIRTETRGAVGLIALARPEALNALNAALMAELAHALDGFEGDDGIGAIVITGDGKAFAAGADVKEMQPKTFADVQADDMLAGHWVRVAACRKPTVAAVAGFALGGGCELAMMCDMILAATDAKFGQPEIRLGTIPGIGGSQRLVRAIGKSKAMEMVLTGRMMDAEEAERAGLVSRVVPAEALLDEAVALAAEIAKLSRPVVMMAKEAVNRAFEASLSEGLRFERRLFHATFATEDRAEGMAAFVERRNPRFAHK